MNRKTTDTVARNIEMADVTRMLICELFSIGTIVVMVGKSTSSASMCSRK